MNTKLTIMVGSVLSALLFGLVLWYASGICEQSYQLPTGDGYVSDDVMVCILPIIPGALIHQYIFFGIDSMVLFWFNYSIPYIFLGVLIGWVLARIRINI